MGGCFEFDGSDDKIDTSDISSTNLYTVSAWFNSDITINSGSSCQTIYSNPSASTPVTSLTFGSCTASCTGEVITLFGDGSTNRDCYTTPGDRDWIILFTIITEQTMGRRGIVVVG